MSDSITDSAAEPRKVSNDVVTVETHSLPDQIAADEYIKNKAVSSNPFRAMKRGFVRFGRI